MPEFLRAVRSYSDALHIVTAGPKLVETTVARLLRHNDITVDSLNFRNVGHEGKLEFKVKKIVEIMGQSSDDVILLGDDVDLDPEVFTEVKKQLGSRVLATYVHVVKNRQIPEGHTRYLTVLDLALRENLAGRLDAAGVSDVIASLNAEKKLSHVFPGFAYCPTDTVIWDWQLSTKFAGEAQDLGRKLTGFCQKGNSK
jgi:phosphatidate phosphatase APP1